MSSHPILAHVALHEFDAGGSLYQVSPIADSAEVLMTGTIDGAPTEPVAWTFTRTDGGKSFYTSLGHPADFENPAFVRMLVNGLCWAAGVEPPEPVTTAELERRKEGWKLVDVPQATATDAVNLTSERAASDIEGLLGQIDSHKVHNASGPVWYRCTIRVPHTLRKPGMTMVVTPGHTGHSQLKVSWNGKSMPACYPEYYAFAPRHEISEVNLLVIQVDQGSFSEDKKTSLPQVAFFSMHDGMHLPGFSLRGPWQTRRGDDPSFATLPLPAIYGASPDILFEP
jgi:hypothetical protein